MPNSLQAFPQKRNNVGADPTQGVMTGSSSQITNIIGGGIPNLGVMTEQALIASVNAMLSNIDQVTGLDLLALATLLESFLPGSSGQSQNLFTQLFNFLTPTSGSTGINVLSPLVNPLLGTFGGLAGGGVAALVAVFNDLAKLLGNPLGLGTGNVVNGAVIPLLSGIIDTFVRTVTGLVGSGFSLDAFGNAAQTLISGAQSVSHLITALIGGITGNTDSSGDPLGVVFGLLNQGLQDIGSLWAQLLGQQATTTAAVTALQNTPGVALFDDFSTSAALAGYVNLVPTLALSPVGPYLQTAHEAVAYRSVGPTGDQHGVHVALGGVQQGVCRVGISCDTAATRWGGLEIYCGYAGDAVRMVVGASPTLTVVQKQADLLGASRLKSVDTFDMWYEVAIKTFHVLRNNQPLFDWPDPTSITTHNASHRKILVTTNGLNRSDAGFAGPGIAKLVGYDK